MSDCKSNNDKNKKIEDIYKDMDEITHILTRPGMWVGSTKEETKETFVFHPETGLMELRKVTYIPALLKIFDEVLSNSCDEFRRSTNLGLTEIDVTINREEGFIRIRDNGGIPVKMHRKAKCYVPEFIFGRLRTSSNYDDTQRRTGVGMNGVGSALTNVFSRKFIIDTADGKKSYHRSWSDNMRKLDDDMKIEKCGDHFTSTTFYVDFGKFDTTEKNNTFSDDFILVCMKRCVDAAAANIGLSVSFSSGDKDESHRTWKFRSFDEYIDLYNSYVNRKNQIAFNDLITHIYVFPCDDGVAPVNIGFVDGAECSKGTHIDAIREDISNDMREFIRKTRKIDISPHSINKQFSLFCSMTVDNPTYNSQTKEELTTPKDKFILEHGFLFRLPKVFLSRLENSELVPSILDWYSKKEDAEYRKTIRKANRESGKLIRDRKFINCNSRRTAEKELWIFEGDSAAGGFRKGRNPQTQAAYQMRGVPMNTIKMNPVDIMKNEVFSDIINITGLKWGKKNEMKNLNFGKFVIASDMDFDGHKIAALLLVFFNHFPELFSQRMVCRIISPIIIASKKGKEKRNYFSLPEFKKDEKLLQGWNIKYIKGLGSQSDSEYRTMMQSNKFLYFDKDTRTDELFGKWFGKGIADTRKDMLRKDVEA